MFSGIIDHCGVITHIKSNPNSVNLVIQCEWSDLQEGESIAVDGICLTVIEPKNTVFRCDISPETYRLTTAKNFSINQAVNLERALRLSDRFGGHIVSGHVDQVATVHTFQGLEDFYRLRITGMNPETLRFIMKKGSVTINGVSLTINDIFDEGFEVMLIPHTLSRTNLKDLTSGSQVNIEYDWLSRVIIRQFDLMKAYL